MVAVASRVLGCVRQTIYDAKKRDPKIDEVIQAERELFVDTAELKLIDAVSKGEPWAITLTLKTVGRHRGYIERVEQHHTGGMTLEELVLACTPNGKATNGRPIPKEHTGTA